MIDELILIPVVGPGGTLFDPLCFAFSQLTNKSCSINQSFQFINIWTSVAIHAIRSIHSTDLH
jgi:hypothetical protein